MEIRTRLAELLREEVRLAGGRLAEHPSNDTFLASTGLDSLGFATIVVSMEQEFGLDPFGGSDEIVYPETFGELVRLYTEAEAHRG